MVLQSKTFVLVVLPCLRIVFMDMDNFHMFGFDSFGHSYPNSWRIICWNAYIYFVPPFLFIKIVIMDSFFLINKNPRVRKSINA